MKRIIVFCTVFGKQHSLKAQQKQTDVTRPYTRLQPDYPVPYIIPAEKDYQVRFGQSISLLDSVLRRHLSIVKRTAVIG
jgi:hypothetical protein